MANLAHSVPQCIEMHAGYDGAVAMDWLRNVVTWSTLLEGRIQHTEFVTAVKNLSTMLQQAMSRKPDIQVYAEAAKVFHKIMLEAFPKVQPRIYEHALLVHVPDMLREASLLDGRSLFLEAFNRVWKHQLLKHTNFGGGIKPETADIVERRSEEGRATYVACMAARMDRTSLASLWTLTDPRVAAHATKWPLMGSFQSGRGGSVGILVDIRLQGSRTNNQSSCGMVTGSAAHLADMSLMADILLIISRSSASLLLF
jgi:hypothetical protein